MAIQKKVRNFSDIMEHVQLEMVPIKFVRHISISYHNGNKHTFLKEDLIDNENVEDFIDEQFESDEITDVTVVLDFNAIQKETHAKVERLLNKPSKLKSITFQKPSVTR